jgi:hypothetical protein
MEHDLRSQIKAMEKSLPPVSPEQTELMEQASRELADSGITGRVLKVGERAPDFTLPNSVGAPVALGTALRRGPVVLTFYRGMW